MSFGAVLHVTVASTYLICGRRNVIIRTKCCPPVPGTTTHQDAFQGWELPPRREALGIATIGDRLHALIPAQLPVPASTKQVIIYHRLGRTAAQTAGEYTSRHAR